MRHMLALVQVHRVLRGRGGSDIGETLALTEPSQKITILLSGITGVGVLVLVVDLDPRFPGESAGFDPQSDINVPSPLTLGDNAFYLIQAAVGTRRATFHNITADLAGTAAAAGLGGASLDRTRVDGEAGGGGLPLALGVDIGRGSDSRHCD
jgi:hypothetical protein